MRNEFKGLQEEEFSTGLDSPFLNAITEKATQDSSQRDDESLMQEILSRISGTDARPAPPQGGRNSAAAKRSPECERAQFEKRFSDFLAKPSLGGRRFSEALDFLV